MKRQTHTHTHTTYHVIITHSNAKHTNHQRFKPENHQYHWNFTQLLPSVGLQFPPLWLFNVVRWLNPMCQIHPIREISKEIHSWDGVLEPA